jgi:hypothetical protein
VNILRRFAPQALLLAVSLLGCAGGLHLTAVRAASNKPSNVVVYFKVEDGKTPVGGLDADSFRIYEDGELVSKFESKQTILNPEVAASHYTLLLVDMSGSIVDGGAVDVLVEAVNTFTDKVEKNQKVAIFAFDGAQELHPIAPFSTAGAKGGAKVLSGYKPKDPSTNLNGAIVLGMKELDKALSTAENPLRFGTLVIFTDGTDRAHRVSNDDVSKVLDDTKYDVFAIGLGAEMKDSELSSIGRSGTAKATDKASVVTAFDTIASRIDAATKSYYLLSYCSPARAFKHKVKIEAVVKDKDGSNEHTGSLESDFDATGFGTGCDPNQKPNFDISKGDALMVKTDPKAGTGGAAATATVKVTAPTATASASGETFTP